MSGFRGMSALLRAVDAHADGRALERAVRQAGRTLVDLTLERFRTETAPDGRPWRKSARALAQGGVTLSDTGALRRSFSSQQVSRDTVAVGTNARYARAHQFGRTIVPKRGRVLRFTSLGRVVHARRVTLPARPMLPERLSAAYEEAIARDCLAALPGVTP